MDGFQDKRFEVSMPGITKWTGMEKKVELVFLGIQWFPKSAMHVKKAL